MRLPHTIALDTIHTYSCSNETQNLLNEIGRRIKAESVEWDQCSVVPLLRELAIKVLVANFSGRTPLDILPQVDFDFLLESLPVTVPMEVTVPLVPDGVYWKRCAQHMWDSMNVVSEYGGSWRRLVVERRLERELENATPTQLDGALRLCRLAGRLIRRVRVRRLLSASSHAADMDILSMDLDLRNSFSHLVHLEELDIMFGNHDFEKNLSAPPNAVKVACCRALGKALSALPAFRRLRVRRSQLHLEKLCGLLEPLQQLHLTELDLSNCFLLDRGSQVVAAFISRQPSLQVLKLANNKIGARGATCLARSLLQKGCAPLILLDLSLNSIGDVGGHNVLMALVPRADRQPLRDPAEDEDVQAAVLAEERRRRAQPEAEAEGQSDGPGLGVFRGLVERAARAFVAAEAEDDDEERAWAEEDERQRKQSAVLADLVQAARNQQQEEAWALAERQREEQARLEAAAREAERWEGAPERLRELRLDACRLGPAAGQAAALVLNTNRALTALSVSNNHLGEDACAALVHALRHNPRVLQLDLRMSGARWQDELVVDATLRDNNKARRAPLRLHHALQERKQVHRARMEPQTAQTEALGRQWGSEAASSGSCSALSRLASQLGSQLSSHGVGGGSSGGFSGLSGASGASQISQSQPLLSELGSGSRSLPGSTDAENGWGSKSSTHTSKCLAHTTTLSGRDGAGVESVI